MGKKQDMRGNPTHRMTKSPEYCTWQHIKARCDKPSNISYKYYGGRGVKVCERWKNSFENFYADMGGRPSSKHSIDRINVDGDYSPDNCRWATWDVQANNMRKNRFTTIDGVTKTRSQWARQYKINTGTIMSRINMGWSEIDAITTPLKKNVPVTYDGKTMTIKEWAQFLNVKHRMFRGRFERYGRNNLDKIFKDLV